MICDRKMLAGKTIFVTGASRGIGKAIALRCAKEKANIVIAAKTTDPHPKLPGTIYTAAKEVEEAGGRALACRVDMRKEDEIKEAIAAAVKEFGGIDILVNNASAIDLSGTESVTSSKYNLMMDLNAKGTFLCCKHCIPHLRKSDNPHILNISPPISRIDNRSYFANGLPYTVSKFCMSLYAYGMAEELKNDDIAVNTLWPKTPVWTAAVSNLPFAKASMEIKKVVRSADIMGDAAFLIFMKKSFEFTGNFLMDEDFLIKEGFSDFSKYSIDVSKL